MKFLVTAGPTREHIDPVRFISNRSSGKMGYAVASAVVESGHSVCLVSGPVSLEPSPGLELVRVVSATEMLDAVKSRITDCDVLVMAAAVCDMRPVEIAASKIKKNTLADTIRCQRTPDILKEMARVKGKRVFVGFAAETDDLLSEAQRKLEEKNLDLIVANDVSSADAGFEVDSNRAVMLFADGRKEELPLMSKADMGRRVVQATLAIVESC